MKHIGEEIFNKSLDAFDLASGLYKPIKTIKVMKRTNEMIFADIRANGFMTEKDMQLLKNRSNKEQKDCFDYTFGAINNGYGIPIDDEWANKGIVWLKSLLKKNGEPKKGQPLGYREIEIIKTAEPDDFTFRGFYDAGRYGLRNYIPVYGIGGMEYYVYDGKIQVVG